MNTVSQIKENGMCCACGICAAVCPVHAISMEVTPSGEVQPVIGSECIQCGKCLSVCSGNSECGRTEEDVQKLCINAASKDENIRRNATSGGFVTTLLKRLLEEEHYDGAFLVKTKNYAAMVQTEQVSKGEDLSGTQKSRYIQVVHTDEVAHILANKEKRYILVGTPCYFRGFLKVVEKYCLNRENYLLIGLFCDKTMTTHVWEYFNRFFADNAMAEMEFRSKVSGGWPGDVALYLQDGKRVDVSRRERMYVKEYFMAESCLLCMDKMNPYADFSVGDNYVSGENGKLGSNSVVIRTERALAVYEHCKDAFEQTECTYEEILKSQKFEKREANLKKNEASGRKKMTFGASGEYDKIREEILIARKRNANPLRRFAGKFRRLLKR
ncbi:MAG: hypothetical protein E7288_01330 [Lachnospiraceae bacterium]|nr:hypothetical protein [Lachnospiraceae bacterium]